MANEEHLAILKLGVEVWNQWIEENLELSPDLSGTDLSGTDLSRADLIDADLSGANLSGANLSRANLSAATLSDADLSRANLSTATLSSANLDGAQLSRATLSFATLCGATLRGANLMGADLSPADLSGANLRGANLRNAILRGADLSRAILSGANLGGVNLSLADINEALISSTSFGDVDLSEVKGLDSVKHEGPSYIDIHTVYKSQGNIPEAFLRGAGVPDNFITYMKSLTGAAFDFYSCFISYSTKDQAFTERLYADLQAKGVRCWYAPHDIQGGKKIHEQIDQAIRLHDKLLLVLSKHSMDSEWVKTEIYKARQREAEEKCRKLFPISLVEYGQVRKWEAFDADIGKDMAREVREYFIPDFTKWEQNTDYQKAFERLMRDLKAEG